MKAGQLNWVTRNPVHARRRLNHQYAIYISLVVIIRMLMIYQPLSQPKPRRRQKQSLFVDSDPEPAEISPPVTSLEPPSLPAIGTEDQTKYTPEIPPLPSSQESEYAVACRCGITGNGYDLQLEEGMVKCEECDNWSHIACQRNGRASNLRSREKFVCDHCNIDELVPWRTPASQSRR